MNNYLNCIKQTLCAHCIKFATCDTIKCALKTGTRITNCKSFVDEDKDAYLRIADNPDLMHLIYDYFLDKVDESVTKRYSNDEIKDIIVSVLKGV